MVDVMANSKPTKASRGVVVLDVDGVITDSVAENFPHAINAYQKLGGKIPATKEIEAKFKVARPLIGSDPTNYFTVLKLIEQTGGKIDFSKVTQSQFNESIKRFSQQSTGFREAYIGSRNETIARDKSAWVKSNKPMPGAIEAVRKIMQKHDTFISTGRDKKSTLEILGAYGIKISPDRVFSKDDLGGKKTNHLIEISKITKTPLNRIMLLDDALGEVKAVRAMGAKGLFARAGYTMPMHLKEARMQKIPGIISLKRKKTRKLLLRKVGRVLRR
ncbi:MAG: HAD family hydrolase [archaeon]|jgi:phosphoglycolate phosphatase-like HAD superfamily hydrolase